MSWTDSDWARYLEECAERWRQAKARARQRREAHLPAWMHGLSLRAQNCLVNEGLDRTPEVVREYGERALLRVPNLGPVTVAEIGRAIGGWET